MQLLNSLHFLIHCFIKRIIFTYKNCLINSFILMLRIYFCKKNVIYVYFITFVKQKFINEIAALFLKNSKNYSLNKIKKIRKRKRIIIYI